MKGMAQGKKDGAARAPHALHGDLKAEAQDAAREAVREGAFETARNTARDAAREAVRDAASDAVRQATQAADGLGLDESNGIEGMRYYQRQIHLPEIGATGQARLKAARVLVVGAGGLGSPLLFALAGAGVGRISIVDFDCVSASNLNRQFLYRAEDIGQPKAELARARIAAYHPDLVVEAIEERLDSQLALRLFAGQDLIVAAVDQITVRRIINAACCRLGKTWIDGGVRAFSGYAALVTPGRTPCYDCLFGLAGQPLPDDAAASACPGTADTGQAGPAGSIGSAGAAGGGVLGATAGVIGSIQANLAVLHLLDLPDPLAGDLFYYDGKTMSSSRVHVDRTPECPVCGSLWGR